MRNTGNGYTARGEGGKSVPQSVRTAAMATQVAEGRGHGGGKKPPPRRRSYTSRLR